MKTLSAQQQEVLELITETLGNMVSIVTIDAALIQPQAGKAAVFLEAPELEAESFDIHNVVWKFDVIAGTPTTQMLALESIFTVLDRITPSDLNYTTMRPVTWTAGSAGKFAAYQIELNPLDND
ncbi:MAG: hypothetical protein L0J71_04760 [Bifidobacterium crudilactis]|nr:hypothetical protein [Bifidobacterium crudilactis]